LAFLLLLEPIHHELEIELLTVACAFVSNLLGFGGILHLNLNLGFESIINFAQSVTVSILDLLLLEHFFILKEGLHLFELIKIFCEQTPIIMLSSDQELFSNILAEDLIPFGCLESNFKVTKTIKRAF
jgi:hypothetical protein